MGLDPSQVGEGKVMESATLGCAHCSVVVIVNPLRTRERAHCFQCNRYICDACEAERKLNPDYVHMPMKKIVDLVATGKATAVQLGVRPLLIPKSE